MALYACLTSLQLRALLSAADDRDSSTDAIQKATCSLHIAHIGVTRGESAARAPSPIQKSRWTEASFSSREQQKKRGEGKNSSLWVLVRPPHCQKKKIKKNKTLCLFHRSSVRNNPARPDSTQRDQIRFREGSLVAGAQQLVPHTQRCSRL